MKMAVNLTILAGKKTQEETIPLVAKAGFDGCFWVTEPGVTVSRLAGQVRREGLDMQFIHAPVKKVDTVWMEGPEGDAFIEMMSDWVRQCGQAQIPFMVSHVWTGHSQIAPNMLGVDRFGKLLYTAEKEGVKIAFENAQRQEFMHMIQEQLWGSPAAGFCFDSGHEMCYNYGADQLAQFGDKLLCTHLNDNLGQTGPEIDTHDDAHMMPFDGVADWKNIAQRLKKAHFQDTLTFELKIQNRPGRHTQDRYAVLQPDEILALARQKGIQFCQLMQ